MSVSMRIRRKFGLVAAGVLLAVALMHAHGFASVLGTRLTLGAEELAEATQRSGEPPALDVPPRRSSAEAIVARNPFDSSGGSETPSVGGPLAELPGDDPWAAPICDHVRVIATTVSGEPDWSMAVLAQTGERHALRRRGSRVGDWTLTHVAWDRAWLQKGESVCQAIVSRASDDQRSQPKAMTRVDLSSGQKGAPAAPEWLRKQISKGRDGEYQIDRSALRKAISDWPTLGRGTVLVPEMDASGNPRGIRVMGVRPDTLPGLLGLQDGDRLEQLNGFDLSTPEGALDAYITLRTADRMTARITRAGQQRNLEYVIR